MSPPAESQNASTVRYQRYRTVVSLLVQHDDFEIGTVRQSLKDEKPAFVTKVINELVQHGWLVRESDSEQASSPSYQWNKGRGEFPMTKWLDECIFGSQISQSPEQTRPRERLLAEGAEKLRVDELLAILIRSGRPGESAVIAGEKLAREFHDRLRDLPQAGRAELKAVSVAIEKTAYCQIMAGIELGRRVAAVSRDTSTPQITSTATAVAWCRQRFARLAEDGRQEEFHIVTLNTKNRVINTHCITIGTLDASLVHPREVFRPAVKDAAATVLLVHNHPSGDCTPSKEDLAVTRRLESAGELLGIEVLDHIVVGKANAVSIRELGLR